MNALLKLEQYGQSYWLDNLTRGMITSGELRHRATLRGLRGVTSNPSIFQRAITDSSDYDKKIEQLADEGCSAPEIYEALTTKDVRDACDVLRPVYERTEHLDGYVSLEVSPHLAHDAEGSIREARRLYAAVDRPNVFIKIPGTTAGVSAIEELLYEGVPVNVTLLFSIERYGAVADAYMRALERRAAAGRNVSQPLSVASFFLSRIDVLVDKLLTHRFAPDAHGDRDLRALLGKAAVANAKLAYRYFKTLVASDRWRSLADRGANLQRLLWASTSTKNPAYRDVMYIEPLIGPATVNTMPEKTIAAFEDHGCVRATLENDVVEADDVMRKLEAYDIDFGVVTEQLLNEGVEKFIEPYDALMKEIESRCRRHAHRAAVGDLAQTAKRLRRQVLRMTTTAGSGHPTSCLSCAEIMAALFFRTMRWDPSDAAARDVDRFLLSKGHAAPILWASLAAAGAIEEDPMTLRRLDSSLEGHPTPSNPWVKVATGSLGQGLAAANGMAIADRLDGIDGRIYCLMGDGECSEGSVWEAAQFASWHELRNVVAIVDANALEQSGYAPYRHDTKVLAARFRSFGWRAIEIDGHDIEVVLDALDSAASGGPTAIIACTIKGKGVSFLEGEQGWHGKALSKEQLRVALEELGDAGTGAEVVPRRVSDAPLRLVAAPAALIPVDEYELGDQVATRSAFGNALKKLGEVNGQVVVLDGDVKNSTHTEDFAQAFPKRFFEGHIAEQNLVGASLGLAASGKVPVAATFACFLSRAADFFRMAGHSCPSHLVVCGSHAGVSIGEDGPSQMGLEDIALFRSVLDSTVLQPCDAVSAERLTELAATTAGLVYLRTARPKTSVIYGLDEVFTVGGSKTLRRSDNDAVTIVGTGVTVHEALTAQDLLAESGVSARVIDAYSIKPLDMATLVRAAQETGVLVIVEDHVPEGGLGEAVAAAIGPLAPIYHLAVRGHPHSGRRAELLARHGIDARAIEAQVLAIMDERAAGERRA